MCCSSSTSVSRTLLSKNPPQLAPRAICGADDDLSSFGNCSHHDHTTENFRSSCSCCSVGFLLRVITSRPNPLVLSPGYRICRCATIFTTDPTNDVVALTLSACTFSICIVLVGGRGSSTVSSIDRALRFWTSLTAAALLPP